MDKEIRKEEAKIIRKAILHIASIPEGKLFLNWLMHKCGFNQSNIMVNIQTMDVNINSMLVNEAIRGLYVDIRKFIPDDKLKEIEFLDVQTIIKEIML